MKLDCHIHVMNGPHDPAAFRRRVAEAGLDGGVVISRPPASFPELTPVMPAAERLADVFTWTGGQPHWYPFFWIDPTEDDAVAQVAAAVQAGVAGFKVICDHFFPGDLRAMPVYAAIAAAGRPLLFHAGILWDGKPSSKYNRPAEFEALLDVPGLRFALAHIGWPWCDETIAVFGKFIHCRQPVEMFIDLTPGTPAIYRREAFTRLFTVGYPVERNIIFGTDEITNNYGVDQARAVLAGDDALMRDIGVSDDVRDAVFGGNLLRFITDTA